MTGVQTCALPICNSAVANLFGIESSNIVTIAGVKALNSTAAPTEGDALKYANEALRKDDRLAKAYFIKGFVYKETKDTANAISSFQTVVELDPDNYDAYILLGNIFSKRGNPIALQYFGDALRIRPSSTEAFYNRGLFLQDAGKLDAAVADYTTLLKLDPGYSDAH